MESFSKFPDKPDWAKYLDSLTDDELENHIAKIHKMENEGQSCNCGNDTVTREFYCTECWKVNRHFKYIWHPPKNERDRWLLLDSKMEDALRNPEEGCYLVETRCNYWEAMRLYFYHKQKGVCPTCKKECTDMRLHHKLARNLGGFEFHDNMVMLCLKCHFETYGEARID